MIILHGEDTVASRQELSKLVSLAKLADKEVLRLSGKEVSVQNLKQALEAQSLFGQERLVVIEEWLGGITSRKKDEAVEYVAKALPDELVVWEKKQLTPGVVKKFGKAKAQEFKLPQLLFSWLDGVSPDNKKGSLSDLRKLLKQQPAEMVLALFQRRVRQLLLLEVGGVPVLKENERIADWQIRKLTGQSKRWGEARVKKLYEDFLKFDYARKRGRSGLSVEEKLFEWVAGL